MAGAGWFIPEYLLLVGAFVALFAERVFRREGAAAASGAAFATLAAVSAAAIGVRPAALPGGVLELDQVAVTVRIALAVLSALYLLWLAGRGMGPERSREAAALALLATLGGMLMVASRDLMVLFISIELATMPAYVLMGYRREDARGLEGALKYFLLSMTTSLVMLYGFSFLFGIAGSTSFAVIGAVRDAGLLGAFAAVFAFVGLFAKMSAAPFHYWAPDAYAGAPAASVAFVSTVPKVAGAAVMVRLSAMLVPGVPALPVIIAVASLASMLLGNLAAFPQSDVRRLMAYSGVAHTGYMLLALSAGTPAGNAAAILYTIAYAVPSMAIMLLAAEEGSTVDDFAGLAARRPAAAWVMVVFLLSLVGVPPMVGMFGKLVAFTAALGAGRLALVLVAVVMSVVSAGYYFRILQAAFFAPSAEKDPVPFSLSATFAVAALAAITLGLGAFIGPLLKALTAAL